MISVHAGCTKLYTKLYATLANIGRLNNKKFVKFKKRKQIYENIWKKLL